MTFKTRHLLGLALALASTSPSQTTVNLRTQSRNVDFGTAPFTRPMKTGTSLPPACTQGDMFFKSDALAGSNLFGCTAAGVWTQQAGGGGGGSSLPSMTGNSGKLLTTDGNVSLWQALGGDIGGIPAAVTVTKLQNRTVSAATPVTGQALIWNGSTSRWEPQPVSGTAGSGSVTVQNSGTVVGTRGVQNFIAGFGLLNIISDTGLAIDIQQGVDTAVIQSKPATQAGTALFCSSASGSANVYTCLMNPALNGYTAGMVVNWRPDINGSGGATTLNVDSLGAKSVKLANGTSNPEVNDLESGRLYHLWYDGSVFRLMNGVISIPKIVEEHAIWPAGCDSTGAGVANIGQIYLPNDGTAATPACGSLNGGLDYLNTGIRTAYAQVLLPATIALADGIDLEIVVTSAAAGTVRFTGAVQCRARNGADMSSTVYSTPQNTTSGIAGGNGNSISLFLSGLTATACSPGNLLRVKIERDNSVGGNPGSAVRVSYMALKYKRTIQ
ncbi:MAG TPA: hypothetical protein VM120_00800 [Bryobacteraceae bacterium]|nr:hypothetical protein [Bryobacteraceae bacterium]